ncbi:16S rRNA (uracil1498-N3)-methyltransferase [Panacagrimonas perspica]|uniref:Ribosomal RNA small subunit methyltransferase E n=1 Tax=Panacagrimonas perspica TaxID=381431 RepID=A0A4R7PDB2_9GAMM|nr:16S rRNA (uracil(1498)-N(3))-methyltransferase [Panacagrimonas perspica]TDU31531.1 16S rRNA (uracil1498-N3)-methyltransferase [Panacagrimonas perspica]THD03231.1 16S rRNA (uracil(1498)-N(3))-methyltransferase [Panacagrimonas perspica]
MSESRIHLDAALAEGALVELPEGPFRHLVQVLRMQAGESLVVFDGRGGEYAAVLETVAKRSASLRVGSFRDVNRESPLHLTLVQGISKGERMDWTVQKAVELGVSAIVPVLTERCNVHLDREREAKRLDHWRAVISSACEQSGRTRVPDLLPMVKFGDWLGQTATGPRLVLDPLAAQGLAGLGAISEPLSLVVGPEGGLSPDELQLATKAGCRGVRIGPRVLRTETAGVAALAILQGVAGDLV